MKIVIIHLSDMHLVNEKGINIERMNKVIETLNALDLFDELCLCLTGDITQSGAKEQYIVAKDFLTDFISTYKSKLKKQNPVKIVMVPGNHDLDYSTDISIKCKPSDMPDTETMKIGLNQQKNFFEFAQIYNCFDSNRYIDSEEVSFSNFTINFNLINTAANSRLEYDRGIQYLPEDELDKFCSNSSNADCTISLLHHSPAYFHESIANSLEKKLYKYSDIVLYGHEHDIRTKTLNYDGISSPIILHGGMFYNQTEKKISQFNIIIIDTNDRRISHSKCEWNDRKKYYKVTSSTEIHEFACKTMLPKKEFIRALMADSKLIADSYDDYFVFPRLTSNVYADNKNYVVNTCQELIGIIKDRKKVNITGGSEAGKTSLLRKIYSELLSAGYYTIFIAMKDFKNFDIKKMRYLFEEQYTECVDEYNMFLQFPKDKKCLVIDDFDALRKGDQKRIVSELENKFGYLVFGSKAEMNFDVRSEIKENIYDISNIATFCISDFVGQKRIELIEKVLHLDRIHSYGEKMQIVYTIENTIKQNIHLFDLRASFLVEYIKYFSEINGLGTVKTRNFNEVFEANLFKRIEKYAGRFNTSSILFLLTNLAESINNAHVYPITEEFLLTAVGSCIKRYDYSISAIQSIKIMKDSGVIVESLDERHFRFASNSYLAYFIARAIMIEYSERDSIENINKIMSSLCFGINGDVLLFLIYQSNNTKLLFHLLDSAEKLFSDWSEYKIFEKGREDELEVFQKIRNTITITIPSKSEVEAINEAEGENEIEEVNNNSSKVTDVYGYNESDADLLHNRIAIAHKYLTTIAKGFLSFNHRILADDKMRFVEFVYEMPNKILCQILKNINDYYDEYESEINQVLTRRNPEMTPKEINEITAKLLTDYITGIIPALYNSVSDIIADNDIMRFLSCGDTHNVNYQIQDLLNYVSLSDLDEVSKRARKIHKNSNKEYVRIIIRKIVRKYILSHAKLSEQELQKLTAEIFNDEGRKKLFIESHNRVV